MQLALFDLDHTLINGDSDYEWARFLIEKGVVNDADYSARNDVFFREYQAGTLDIDAFLDFQLEPLSRYPVAQLADWHREFMAGKIMPIILPAARMLVARHAAEGALCAIVTATNSFVTGPIARELGVANLIATDPEIRDGRYTGKPAGTPCFQAGKITRVREWLAGQRRSLADFEKSWFYSDSRNDLPLLREVTHPVAVDPHEALLLVASEPGWPVISLRGLE